MAKQPRYRVPSETHPHLRTLLAWPDLTSTPKSVGFVKQGDLELARQEVSSIANAISRFEPVWLYTKPANVEAAKSTVSERVTVKPLDIDQLWIRDTGPIFVFDQDGNTCAVDTNFNYWGGNFTVPGEADTRVAQRILDESSIPRIQASFISEGGALEFDGEGTLMVTESSLINPNRNPGTTKQQLEAELMNTFGVRKIIWLKGVAGVDDTDFHIDAFARFAPNDTILLSRPNAYYKEFYGAYVQAKEALSRVTNAAGRPLKVVEIEEAETVPRADKYDPEDISCLSYVDYYLAKGAVIVPLFGDRRTDAKALDIISQAWPGREVVPVTLNWMAWAGGGIHCATQQWPMALDRS